MQNNLENTSWQNEFPTLANMPKEVPFEVPENYFETLNDKIKNKAFLSKMPQKDFAVPKDYFEHSRIEILAKTAGKKENTFKIVKLLKYFAAASVLLIVGFSIYLMQVKTQSTSSLTTAEQQREQLMYELDEMVILDEINTSKQIKEVSTDEMEAYILHNYSTHDIVQEYKIK